MEHGKKAYGEDSFQKTGGRGFCRPLRISRMKKRRQGPKSGIAIFFYVCTCILYLSFHGGRVSKFCRSRFSEERQGE